ncbi:MAG: molybdopterin-binding protein [Nitrospirota bacterium]
MRSVPLKDAVGMVLAHDITEIRPGEFKGRAFRKGQVIHREDICHLQRLGKESLFILEVGPDEMHEDEAARELAHALAGEGVAPGGEPREGKIELVAARDGLLKVHAGALHAFNMQGEVMCASLHTNTVVRKGRVVAATRAIPLVIKRSALDEALAAARSAPRGVLEVKPMRRPRAGKPALSLATPRPPGDTSDIVAPPGGTSGTIIVIVPTPRPGKPYVTANTNVNIRSGPGSAYPTIGYMAIDLSGEVVGLHYVPDEESAIEGRMRELLEAGADLLITTGGMSVDPDDVTRFAIARLGATGIVYGSAVLPGAMLLVAYLGEVPVLGVPACGLYHRSTAFDLVLPRVLAGERITRGDLAALGHGGLCLNCPECRYPVCPFGKGGSAPCG